MKKIGKTLAVVLASILTLGGCVGDPYPELTDAQYEVVVRYAASLLTRYCKGSGDKLAYLDASYTPEHLMAQAQQDPVPEEPAPPEAQADAGNSASTQPVPVQENEPQPEEEPESATTENTEDEPAAPEGEPESEPGSTEPAAPVVSYTLIEDSGLQTLAPNVHVEYTGYSVKSVYPDTQSQGAVSAAQGDKLLVIDFSIQNLGDVPAAFNTAARNPQFKLNINSSVEGFTMVTMIPNDLSGMDRELAPGERADAVLLMEVPESLAKSVDTLDLIIKIRGEDEQTVKLE